MRVVGWGDMVSKGWLIWGGGVECGTVCAFRCGGVWYFIFGFINFEMY